MFGPACIQAMRVHALAEYPRESAGMVVDGEYWPLVNESPDPDAVMFDERVALRHGTALQALVHSHPNGPAYPSYQDQVSQIAWGIPWGIVSCNESVAAEPIWWGDGTPRPPYIPRVDQPVGFRWVVDDCYQRIRDAFWQGRGIRLKEFAREWGAWKAGPGRPAFSGYLHHYRDGGFVEVDRPQEWDLAVMRFSEEVAPSHAGVLLAGNMLLHHLGDPDEPVALSKIARREPIGRWMRCIRGGGFWLRYVGAR